MKKLLLIITTVIYIQICNAQTDTIDYFGQTPPGNTPILFAPNFIGDAEIIKFRPDGKEIYFRNSNGYMVSQYKDGQWTLPVTTTLPRNAVFTSNGKGYYSLGEDTIYTFNWTDSSRTSGVPCATLNVECNLLSVANNGNIYIATPGDNYILKYENNTYQTPVKFPDSIGTTEHLFIAPDESYIIFDSKRSGGYGNNDLYVSFRKTDSTWTEAKNLGTSINTAGFDYTSCVSPDGKYLFYAKNTRDTYDNIYWVDIKIIDKFRPTSVGIIEDNSFGISVFPNPSTGHITLSFGTSQNHESLVEICNLQGTQVFSKTFQNTTSVTIDLTGNSAGIYFIKVIADGSYYEKKIIRK
jgi:hypothetical protein